MSQVAEPGRGGAEGTEGGHAVQKMAAGGILVSGGLEAWAADTDQEPKKAQLLGTRRLCE